MGIQLQLRKQVWHLLEEKNTLMMNLRSCNVHHCHLIRLGYCCKGPLLFLVHGYMENGSLDQFLYGDKSRNLTWRHRFEIIFGTAKDLAYLHEQYHVTIIIKTSNILLDNEFQPKIADFGPIRLLPEDKIHLSTKLAGCLNQGRSYSYYEYGLIYHINVLVTCTICCKSGTL